MSLLVAMGRFIRRPGVELLTFFPLALTTLALSLVVTTWHNAGISPEEILRPQVAPIAVEVDREIDPGIVAALRLRVQELPAVARAELVEQAGAPRLAVHLRPGTEPEVAHRLSARLAEWGEVRSEVGEGWDSPKQLRRVALAVAIFSLLSGLGVMWSVLRHRVFARRRELVVMHLLGATRRFLARPHMVLGFVHTAAAVGLAYWLTNIAYTMYRPEVDGLLESVFAVEPVGLIAPEHWLIAGGVLGCFGAWTSRGAVKQIV